MTNRFSGISQARTRPARHDISVDTAESADAALEKLQYGTFDAIVLDYEMTGMNGIELLKKLKSNGNGIPFILFTGRGREEIALEALTNGAAFYIHKGGEPKSQFAELTHKIREAVRRERAERTGNRDAAADGRCSQFSPRDPMIAIDEYGRLIVWNKAAEDLTGVSVHVLLGKGDYEYAIPFYGKLRPLLIDLVLHPDEKILLDYYRVTKNAGDLIYAESRITLRDSRTRVLWIKATPLHDAGGRVRWGIETVRDITVRKQISEDHDRIQQNLMLKNEEIVRANERLAATEKDLQRRNEELGEAFEEMAAVEEELRLTFLELQESHRSLQEREEDYRLLVESQIARTDGTVIPVKITLCPTRHKGEEAVIAVLRDVTVRRRYEGEIRSQTQDLERQAKALAQANPIITLMSTVTRHDILNQLSVLLGNLSLAKQIAADDTLLACLTRQENAAEAIERHILFTPDYKEICVCDPDWQDIHEVFSRAVTITGASRVRFDIDEAGFEVYADHILENVFSNLIDTSLRHAGKISAIGIAVFHSNGSLVLSYENDGAGIPACEKARIFEREYGKNTGLGLFLVQEILAITGITIVENGDEGRGARFEM